MGSACCRCRWCCGCSSGRRARTRIGPTWDCGLRADAADGIHRHRFLEADPDDLQGALPPPARGAARVRLLAVFRQDLRFESHIEEAFVTRIYRPLNRGILRLSRRMRALQAGSIQAYLIYIFITLLLLLMFAL
jgi:hydrogenase-4 component B